jgi:hypothetical protein
MEIYNFIFIKYNKPVESVSYAYLLTLPLFAGFSRIKAVSGNSPFGTPALIKNAERYEW